MLLIRDHIDKQSNSIFPSFFESKNDQIEHLHTANKIVHFFTLTTTFSLSFVALVAFLQYSIVFCIVCSVQLMIMVVCRLLSEESINKHFTSNGNEERKKNHLRSPTNIVANIIDFSFISHYFSLFCVILAYFWIRRAVI